jgi:hypothetical protein
MRQQHRRAEIGQVRSEDPKDTTRPLLLASCCSEASSIERLYRASSTTAIVAAGGGLALHNPLILNELGPGPAEEGAVSSKMARNRPWTRLADSPKQVNATNSPTPSYHPVEIESTAIYHCDQYEAHASYGGGSRAIEAGIKKIGEPR